MPADITLRVMADTTSVDWVRPIGAAIIRTTASANTTAAISARCDGPGSHENPHAPMTVKPWEIWTLCQMLITTHGDEAETHARAKMNEADSDNKSGERLVWKMVIDRMPECRANKSNQSGGKTT